VPAATIWFNLIYYFRCSENVTTMSLFSALEDLQATTLDAIAGSLRQLEYLASLRRQDGSYAHWGLARMYGELRARRALADAHRAQLSRVLATPIRKLEKDVRESSEEAGVSAKVYLERLSESSAQLLPPNPGAGSSRHLSSVLHVLSSLQKARKLDASPPA
jgi:hypothetical protein